MLHSGFRMQLRGLEKYCGLCSAPPAWLSAARSMSADRLHLTFVQYPTRLALVKSNPLIAKLNLVLNGMEAFCCSVSLKGEILDLLCNIYSANRAALSDKLDREKNPSWSTKGCTHIAPKLQTHPKTRGKR